MRSWSAATVAVSASLPVYRAAMGSACVPNHFLIIARKASGLLGGSNSVPSLAVEPSKSSTLLYCPVAIVSGVPCGNPSINHRAKSIGRIGHEVTADMRNDLRSRHIAKRDRGRPKFGDQLLAAFLGG